MSATQEVVRLIERKGSATVDDLLPDMEGYTRAQVLNALSWAQYRGLIESAGLPRKKGEGVGRRTGLPATYRAVKKPIVASVWDLALAV